MKRMLINATQEEELRVALVDGQRLYDLNIELPASERKKANIYKGKITRIEPSLEAAFVDYGAERHGFLPLKEISSEYFVSEVQKGSKPSIKEVLKEGQDIVVQIDKEERGNKGAALTTYVSLAGRFIVLKPNKSRSGGVSRRIVGRDRDLARSSLAEIEVPKGMSVILRTAGIDRSAEELAWDLDNLMQIWQAILNVVLQRPSPFLIYRESNAVVRALRDNLTTEIGEILIDDETTFTEAREFVEQVMPHNLKKLKQYTDHTPLFTRFQIESQIESAFAHAVSLPSGGSLVIDHTEALTSIDINSARATKGGDIEATALNTNLEAAEEIGRQLRIRDLGGLIVIDFIDMGPQKHQRDVENRLREAVRADRARVQIGKISRFGLLEMSRQRLRPSLGESAYQTCPRCSGFGTIRSVESLALAILRIVGEEARKERTAKVIAQLPVEVATYLLNEKRDWVRSLESQHQTQVILVANSALETPHYDVRRVRDDQIELPENVGVSYALADTENELEIPETLHEEKVVEVPAIGTIKPTAPAPRRKVKRESLWARIFGLFTGGAEEPKKKKKKTTRGSRQKRGETRTRRGREPQRGRRDAQQAGKKRPADRRGPKGKKKKKAGAKSAGSGKSRQAKDDGRKQQKPQGTTAEADKQAGDESRKPPRTRRSRGGRRRRRAPDQQRQRADKDAAEQRDSAESPRGDKGPAADKVAAKSGGPAAEKSAEAEGRSDPGAAEARTKTTEASKAAASPKPATKDRPPRTEEPAAPTQPKSGNGSPADEARPAPAAEAKPAGRLLPWEPAGTATVEKAPDKAAKTPKPAASAENPPAE